MAILIILSVAASILIYLAYYFSNTISSPSLWPELQQINITGPTATIQMQLSNETQSPLLRPRIEVLGNLIMIDHSAECNNVEKIDANETVAFEMAITSNTADTHLAMKASRAKILISFVTSEGEERYTQFNLKSGMFRETRRKP
ncbi:MAG: hypothetical protein EOO20_22755 [Chryseobacterium sp.]|nr:MAG: hypothetical protein EOO20_22755 [Chryseobacterium sp.]